MRRLAEVIKELETAYPPDRAEAWDAVGLVSGDPDQPVRRVLFAVDPVPEVAEEALDWGAHLIVTHHPLHLRGTTTVAATSYKGRLLSGLIRADVALYTAHTNADVANPGVSDALARAVGLAGDLLPLQPFTDDPWRGLGRVGDLPEPVTLAEFARAVRRGLPETPRGVWAAGDPDRQVQRVAVSGGAGDSLLDAARAAGVDAFLTSDLRHHPASEFIENGGPALLDAPHWATEWPWLPTAAALLDASGLQLETRVSTVVTDVWTQAALD